LDVEYAVISAEAKEVAEKGPRAAGLKIDSDCRLQGGPELEDKSGSQDERLCGLPSLAE